MRHRPDCRFAGYTEDEEAARVEQLSRAALRLSASMPVLVREMETHEKGFPPLETRISFWTGNDGEHRWRLFKPMAEVKETDLPPWWLKEALKVDDISFCGCCG